MINSRTALLIVDVQNDFCPGGSLAVPEGDRIIPVLNKYIGIFIAENRPIFASRDWHPAKTAHFKQYGGVWPVHCVQNTFGAAFYADMRLPRSVVVLSKGMNPAEDSYSAFQAQDESGELFLQLLEKLGIRELWVGGLATDYCVKSSAIDALQQGLKVKVLADAIKGVNLKPNDSAEAIKEMVANGAELIDIKGIEDRK